MYCLVVTFYNDLHVFVEFFFFSEFLSALIFSLKPRA